MKLIGLLRHLNSDKCKLISPINEHVINTAPPAELPLTPCHRLGHDQEKWAGPPGEAPRSFDTSQSRVVMTERHWYYPLQHAVQYRGSLEYIRGSLEYIRGSLEYILRNIIIFPRIYLIITRLYCIISAEILNKYESL